MLLTLRKTGGGSLDSGGRAFISSQNKNNQRQRGLHKARRVLTGNTERQQTWKYKQFRCSCVPVAQQMRVRNAQLLPSEWCS